MDEAVPTPRAEDSTLERDGNVAELYNRWAGTYDRDRNRTRDLAARALRSITPSLAGRDVVELGCGTGHNSVWLVERARRVVGLELVELREWFDPEDGTDRPPRLVSLRWRKP